MEALARSSAEQHELFDLRCRNEYLSARVEELAGGAGGAALADELTQARASLAGKEQELAELNELFMLVPRGKYDYTFQKERMTLHGKSFTYQIDYHNVGKVF